MYLRCLCRSPGREILGLWGAARFARLPARTPESPGKRPGPWPESFGAGAAKIGPPMANYAQRGATPTTLTDREIALVLGYTGRHSRTIRDHLLISMALGTGAREHELLALDRADVVRPDGEIRRRVQLRTFKGCRRADARAAARQWLVFPDECRRKLALYLPRVPSGGPLFPSRLRGRRLSARQLRELWSRIQVAAGLERHHPFHHLRHTYASNLYDRTRNAVLVQRSARHARLETTMVYVAVSDEQQDRAHRQLPC